MPTSPWDQAQPAGAHQFSNRAPQPQVVKIKQKRGCFGTGLAIIGLLVVLLIGAGIIAALVESGQDDEGRVTDAPEATLFPGRADSQDNDQERELGAPATINDLEATVNSVEFVQELSSFETAGYFVVTVTYVNKADRALPYNVFDWRIQTSGGQVNDPGLHDHTLGSGDLVPGGTVTGTVIFDAVTPDGFILWKPFFDSDRGIWKVG